MPSVLYLLIQFISERNDCYFLEYFIWIVLVSDSTRNQLRSKRNIYAKHSLNIRIYVLFNKINDIQLRTVSLTD